MKFRVRLYTLILFLTIYVQYAKAGIVYNVNATYTIYTTLGGGNIIWEGSGPITPGIPMPLWFNFSDGQNIYDTIFSTSGGYLSFSNQAANTVLPPNILTGNSEVIISAFGEKLEGGTLFSTQISSGSNVFTSPVLLNLSSIGDTIQSSGFPPGTTISNINGNLITTSQNALLTLMDAEIIIKNGRINFYHDGIAPNRKFNIEFHHMHLPGNFNDDINFKIEILENTNMVFANKINMLYHFEPINQTQSYCNNPLLIPVGIKINDSTFFALHDTDWYNPSLSLNYSGMVYQPALQNFTWDLKYSWVPTGQYCDCDVETSIKINSDSIFCYEPSTNINIEITVKNIGDSICDLNQNLIGGELRYIFPPVTYPSFSGNFGLPIINSGFLMPDSSITINFPLFQNTQPNFKIGFYAKYGENCNVTNNFSDPVYYNNSWLADSLPFILNFATATEKPFLYSLAHDNAYWSKIINSGSPLYGNLSSADSGYVVFKADSFSFNSVARLTSPCISFDSLNSPVLKITRSLLSANENGACNDTISGVYIEISTDEGNHWDPPLAFLPFFSSDDSAATWINNYINLSNYSGINKIRLCLRAQGMSNAGMMIDRIEISENQPGCVINQPGWISKNISGLILHWNENIDVTNYDLIITHSGNSDTLFNVHSPMTLNTLSVDSMYLFELIATCSSGSIVEPIALYTPFCNQQTNDTCNNSLLLNNNQWYYLQNMGINTGNNSSCVGNPDDDKWYIFQTDSDIYKSYSIELNSNQSGSLCCAMYYGSCSSLIPISCSMVNPSSFSLIENYTNLLPSTTYYLQIFDTAQNNSFSQASYELMVRDTMDYSELANDLCINSYTIQCGDTLFCSNEGMNSSFPDPSGLCNLVDMTGINGVWYKFIGDGSQITLSTCGSQLNDTRMAIYTGNCYNLSCLESSDYNAGICPNSQQATIIFNSQPGTEYYLLLGGSGGTTGNYKLTASCNQLSVQPVYLELENLQIFAIDNDVVLNFNDIHHKGQTCNIYNLEGSLLKSVQLASGQTSYRFSTNLASSLYLVKVIQSDRVHTKLVYIQNRQ